MKQLFFLTFLWLAAGSTFSAFLVCGLAPLIPYLFGMTNAFWFATLLTGAVFFAIGSVKSMWSTSPWWRSGLETLLVGSAAAGLKDGQAVSVIAWSWYPF